MDANVKVPPRLSREEYDAALAKLFLPDRVIATRPNPRSVWIKEEGRSPYHNQWLISDSNPHLAKEQEYTIDFDCPIGPDYLTLSDEEFLHDAMTKRIYCIRSLDYGIHGQSRSSGVVARFCDHFDWIVRFKYSQNIASFSDVTNGDFNNFITKISTGLLSLVPMEKRIEDFLHRVEFGEEFYTAKGRNSETVFWSPMAFQLGVSRSSLRDPSFRSSLLDRMASRIPNLAALISEGMIFEKSKPERFSVKTLRSWTAVWEDLRQLSIDGFLKHDPLSIDPFSVNSQLSIAKHFGRASTPTPTLPPEFLLALMRNAVPWVFEYGPWILQAIERGRELESLPIALQAQERRRLEFLLNTTKPVGLPNIWPAFIPDADHPSHLTFTDLISLVITSCAILVSALAARRLNETLSLQFGCLLEKRKGVYSLLMYIEKTLQDFAEIPVPKIFKGIISLLENASERTRGLTGEKFLFKILRKGLEGERVYFNRNLNKGLKFFVDFHKIEVPVELNDWSLASHQLRRGFCITYFYGFELRDVDSLSSLLGHLDPEMTRLYVLAIIPGKMSRLKDEMKRRRATARANLSEEDKAWLREAKKVIEDLRQIKELWEAERSYALEYRLMCLAEGTDEVVAGKGGEWLLERVDEMIAQAQARVRIGSRTNDPAAVRGHLIEIFKDFARRVILEPVPGHMMHCAYVIGSDTSNMNCLKLKASFEAVHLNDGEQNFTSDPDVLFGGLHPCIHCAHCVVLKKNAEHMERELARLEVDATTASTEAFRKSAKEYLDEVLAQYSATAASIQGRRK